MAIHFYSTKDEYGAFSNFSKHPFELEGVLWPTSEHYFQAHKFEDTEYREKIRTTPSAMIAARLGRSRKVPIRSDWEEKKDEVMLCAVFAKFQSHSDLKELLLSTGDEDIIEKTTRDYYWGCGTDGSGKNMLGKILMRVRDELRSNTPLENTAPLVCNLAAMTAAQRQRHSEVIIQLRTAIKEVKEVADGYEFRYAADPALVMAAAEFITLESRCCPFYTFILEVGPGDGPMWLRVTGPVEAKPFIQKALTC